MQFFFLLDIFAESNKRHQIYVAAEKFPTIEIKMLDLEEELPLDIKNEDLTITETINNKTQFLKPDNFSIIDTEKKEDIKKSGAIYSILLDATKSLSKSDFENLKNFIKEFIQNTKENDLKALYSLNGRSKKIQNFTNQKAKLLDKLETINLKGKETKLYDAIYSVLLDLNKFSKKRKEEIGGLLVFTDGKEESSLLKSKDIEELIIYGTKFEIPIYFILSDKKTKPLSFEKISLKTGGKIIYDIKDLVLDSKEAGNGTIYIKSLSIQYKSKFSILDTILHPNITTEIHYKDKKILQASYSVVHYNYYWIIGIVIFVLFIVMIFLWYFWNKKRTSTKISSSISKEKKIEFPEPQIGEIFADLRQYSDKAEKKYIESEEKSQVPLMAQNWMEPIEYFDFDDPYIKKKMFKDVMNLSLKEKSYMVLQMALKEAPKYTHGVLVKKDREGLGYDKRFDLFLDEVYIGSSSSAHIPVRDPSVSGIHSKIKRIDNKFILFDLMSMTGTYLNGKKVLRPMPLRHNDEIRMGHTVFRFVGED